MKKILLLFSFILFFISFLFGKPVDPVTANAVASNFFNVVSEKKGGALELAYTCDSKKSAAAYYYVFNASGGGFVIVSGDDNAEPVLGYSFSGSFDKENMPPNKYMRIVGESEDNPWKFEGVTLEDFALKNLPDFELVGNILNANKTLEANKAFLIYDKLVQENKIQPFNEHIINEHYGLIEVDKIVEKIQNNNLIKKT